MANMSNDEPVTLRSLTVKAVVVHTVTYFVAGVLAFTVGGYQQMFLEPPLSDFMRPPSDRWVMAGPLLQPLRGILFALALYPVRHVLFVQRRGWMILWWLLLALGILSTFGPAPGSVEGLIYTVIPVRIQLFGLLEIVVQSLLLSAVLVYWIRHPRKWLDWVLGAVFCLVMILPALGLFVTTQ